MKFSSVSTVLATAMALTPMVTATTPAVTPSAIASSSSTINPTDTSVTSLSTTNTPVSATTTTTAAMPTTTVIDDCEFLVEHSICNTGTKEFENGQFIFILDQLEDNFPLNESMAVGVQLNNMTCGSDVCEASAYAVSNTGNQVDECVLVGVPHFIAGLWSACGEGGGIQYVIINGSNSVEYGAVANITVESFESEDWAKVTTITCDGQCSQF